MGVSKGHVSAVETNRRKPTEAYRQKFKEIVAQLGHQDLLHESVLRGGFDLDQIGEIPGLSDEELQELSHFDEGKSKQEGLGKVEGLVRLIIKINQKFPDELPLFIAKMSKKHQTDEELQNMIERFMHQAYGSHWRSNFP